MYIMVKIAYIPITPQEIIKQTLAIKMKKLNDHRLIQEMFFSWNVKFADKWLKIDELNLRTTTRQSGIT